MTVRGTLAGLGIMLAVAATGCTEIELDPPTDDASVARDRGDAGQRDARVDEPLARAGQAAPKPKPPSKCPPTAAPGLASGTSATTGATSAVPETLIGPTVQSEKAPPPITGGTMLTSADRSIVVAADPDRDQLYFVDAHDKVLMHTRKLNAGDQPGRIVEDAAGRIHVVLRGGHAIASLNRELTGAIKRRDVCALPRGIAYDAVHDQLHVACAEGKVVTLNAAPYEDKPTRTLELGTDIRDVIARDGKLFVTRFRSAQLLVLNADGSLQETRTPPSFGHTETRTVAVQVDDAGMCLASPTFETKNVRVESTPTVAWRAIDVPTLGVTMLHQRAQSDEIQITQGGYGAGGCGPGIVQTAVTSGLDTRSARTADMVNITLAVDVAVDPSGGQLAIVAPGNHGVSPQLQILNLAQLQTSQDVDDAGVQFPRSDEDAGVGGVFAPCVNGTLVQDPEGQATSVTYVSASVVAVQEREPAAISFYDLPTQKEVARVSIDTAESRFDTGHALFHTRAGAGIACASCHPEAGDDGHVWTFASIGPRRTQTLRGGLLGTEPLHWNGDMADFSMLMDEVFVGRMLGFNPSSDQTQALAHWVDRQPALHADAANMDAAARGKELFESSVVGCASCHAGSHLTNNQTVDVGTGAELQVPSLKGVRFRTPLMHTGCAASIKERLTNPSCGGGDSHGQTSQLSEDEIDDLTAYVETL